jgi:hypothetical protein
MPNIAVNGYYENVIELALGKQKSGSAVDGPEVRKAVTD